MTGALPKQGVEHPICGIFIGGFDLYDENIWLAPYTTRTLHNKEVQKSSIWLKKLYLRLLIQKMIVNSMETWFVSLQTSSEVVTTWLLSEDVIREHLSLYNIINSSNFNFSSIPENSS